MLMRQDKQFLVVGGALFIGFWIGFAAGLDNPTRENIEWETLAAGAAAIFGGWLAYVGARGPFDEKRSRIAERHAFLISSHCSGFLFFTDPDTLIGQGFFPAHLRNGRDGLDVLWNLIRRTAEAFPELPPEIADKNLMAKHHKVVTFLRLWKPHDRLNAHPSVVETRGAILDYIRAVEARSGVSD
jgi:hypothetical protein